MPEDHDTPLIFLRPRDFATKVTTGGTVPNRLSRPDQIALWRLANRTLLVDTEAGVICRADGVKRAETPTPKGYGKVYLGRIDGKIRWAQAHRVVWIAAYGEIPGMYEINHENGRRWDNRLANLELVTHADNMRHAYRLPYTGISLLPGQGPDDRPLSPISSSQNRMVPERNKRANFA